MKQIHSYRLVIALELFLPENDWRELVDFLNSC